MAASEVSCEAVASASSNAVRNQLCALLCPWPHEVDMPTRPSVQLAPATPVEKIRPSMSPRI
eukprot:10595645-Alexandrium_andersonii.AAC.1